MIKKIVFGTFAIVGCLSAIACSSAGQGQGGLAPVVSVESPSALRQL